MRTLLSRENMTLLSTELLVLQVKSKAFSNNQIWFLKCYQQRMCDIHCNVDKHFYPYLNHLCICRIFFLNFMMKVFCSFPDYGEVFIILLSKNTSYCIAQFSTASFINNLLILSTWTEHICVCVWCVCVYSICSSSFDIIRQRWTVTFTNRKYVIYISKWQVQGRILLHL